MTNSKKLYELLIDCHQNMLTKKGTGARDTIATSGLDDLDRIIGGLRSNSMTLLAGRPGMGCTSAALTIAINCAKQKKSVGFISSEFSGTELALRIGATLSGIEVSKVLNPSVTDFEVGEIVKRVDQMGFPVHLSESRIKSREQFEDTLAEMVKNKIDILVLDQIDTLSIEYSELQPRMQSFKTENEIPLVITTKVGWSVEERGGDKRPMLMDVLLAEQLEDIADVILLLYRPEYYGLVEDENGMPTEGFSEIIIAKNQFGRLDTVRTRFNKDLLLFENLEKFKP